MKSGRTQVELIALYEELGSYRAVGALLGCDHKTVKRYVQAAGEAGQLAPALSRCRVTDDFADLICERVEQTGGRVTARRLMRLVRAAGYEGSERSLRRAVAAAKATWRQKQALEGRVYRPWVSEPGEWLLCDWGAAGTVQTAAGARKLSFFSAVLGWSRYRTVSFSCSERFGALAVGLAASFEAVGGVPARVLFDNPKTVATAHLAGAAVLNWQRQARVLLRPGQPADRLPDPSALGDHEMRLLRAAIAQVSGKAGGYYGCLGAAKGACENKMLVRRKLAEKVIVDAVRERISDPAQIRYVLERVEAEVKRLRSDLPETIRLKEAALTAEERRLANFLDSIGEGRGSKALGQALAETERKVLSLREDVDGLRCSREKVFRAPPIEWISERVSGLQDLLEARTGRSALILRELLGPIQLKPVPVDVGRPYYRAVTSIDALALVETPPAGEPAEGGSNSLRKWRRWESNPRPRPREEQRLRAYPAL